MQRQVDESALDLIFRGARSHSVWLDRPVDDATLHRLYELLRFGPTSANSSPARFVFLRGAAVKERLRPHLSPTNVDKVMSAPVTAIVAHDLEFHLRLPQLFPHNPDMPGVFEDNEPLRQTTAFRNGSLQGAYMIVAARALGLDCGPMSGFNNAGVDGEFFPDGKLKSNFLCNLGYGDHEALFPRNPRLGFEEACTIL